MNVTDPLDLSVTIITRNEERTLGPCIQSLPQNCEIIVIDSNSSDSTVEVAKSFGARVEIRKFENYADQKNFALSLASRHWVLSIDADETLDQTLRDAIIQTVSTPPTQKILAYRLKRHLVFLGRKLRYGRSTDFPIRLFQKKGAQFVGAIHESIHFNHSIKLKTLPGQISHFSYENLSDYLDKFNSYTSRMADASVKHSSSQRFLAFQSLRLWFEFFHRYFLRLGFLDGYPGYCYAVLSSFYRFVKFAKTKELVAAYESSKS